MQHGHDKYKVNGTCKLTASSPFGIISRCAIRFLTTGSNKLYMVLEDRCLIVTKLAINLIFVAQDLLQKLLEINHTYGAIKLGNIRNNSAARNTSFGKFKAASTKSRLSAKRNLVR